MTTKQQVYSCRVCGQIVAVVHQGGGRLVCCGQPMMLAGEETSVAAEAGPRVRQEPVAATKPAPATAPHWQCSKCHYVLQAEQPPETCPSCHEHCQFTDVTCYIPECGFAGMDTRLVG
jgi:desulfoferrodoxin-like iron-binding protein